ncbi:MAG: hypothetical protein KAT46_04870 [Deltaproteobacteria bacterium]|nr:hypothetical protein [Deltaproteobacteria bacterium]
MLKKNTLFILVLTATLAIATFLTPAKSMAGYDITFAPAPITKPVEVGENGSRMNLDYVTIDTDDAIIGYGFDLSFRTASTPSSGMSGTFEMLTLDSDSGDTYGLVLAGAVNYEIKPTGDKHTTIFIGVPVSLSALSSDVGVNTVDISIITYGLQVGALYNYEVSPSSYLTPYLIVATHSGTATVDDFSTTTDVDVKATTTVLGLDFALAEGISFGASLQTGGEAKMTTLQFGFTF